PACGEVTREAYPPSLELVDLCRSHDAKTSTLCDTYVGMSTAGRFADSDSSLAARELNFLVRLAQAAASTQSSDALLQRIIRETTSAIGTDVCSLYLLAPDRKLLLTATNGLNEGMVGKVAM